MRQEVIIKNIYTFDELSYTAQQNVISNYWNNTTWDDLPYLEEDLSSIKAIAAAMGVTYELNNYCGLEINLDFYYGNKPEEEMELCGKRAIAYIWNNFIEPNLTYKQYWTNLTYDENNKVHFKKRVSKCQKHFSCPFTGTCFDDTLYGTFQQFCKKIKNGEVLKVSDFIESVANNLSKDWNSNIDYIFSEEYIKEDIEINNIEFYEDGTAA